MTKIQMADTADTDTATQQEEIQSINGLNNNRIDDDNQEQLAPLNVPLCSGYGQNHTSKYGKPYIETCLNDIFRMVKNPLSVDKNGIHAQWFIPSTLKSRVHKEQRENGQFYALWADIDKLEIVGEAEKIIFAEIVRTFQDAILPDTEAILYTTASATPEKQKSRIIIPLIKPVDGQTYIILQTILNDKLQALGITPDRANERTGQLCYLPNKGIISKKRPEIFYQYEILTGKTFNRSVWDLEINTLTERLKIQAQEQQARQARAMQQVQERIDSGQADPMQAYKDAYPVETALERYGYVRCGNDWLSPNSESGKAGVVVKDGKAYSHHSGDKDIPKSNKGCFDSFDLFTFFECGNDKKQATIKAGEMFTINGLTINKHNQIEYMKEEERKTLEQARLKEIQIDKYNDVRHYDEPPPPKEEIKAPVIEFCSFADIYKANPQPEWIIKDFIPKGEPTLISATGGVGKSMFSLYLAHHLSTESEIHKPDHGGNLNIDFNEYLLFEEFPIVQSGICSLFLQTENSNAQLNFRMRKIAGDNIEPLSRIFSPVINNSALASGKTFIEEIKKGETSSKKFENWFETLINNIQDQTKQKIEMVWLDPLISFCGCNENDNAEMRQNLDVLTTVSQKCEVTPIVIHHNAKNSKEYRGASAIFDWTRNLISLNRIFIPELVFKDGKNQTIELPAIKVTHDKCNVGRTFKTFNIRMDDNFRFTRLKDETLDPKIVKICMEVVKALSDLGGSADSQNELIKKYIALTGVSRGTAHTHISHAAFNGFISAESVGDSYSYELIEN